MSLVLETEKPADLEGIRALQTAAFMRAAEAQLVDSLRAGGWAELSLVARLNGELVGHVLFSRLAAPIRALSLGPIAVDPGHQGKGIGSALVKQGLLMAAERGWEAVFVLGEPKYYQRFGFSLEAARGFDCPYSGDYFMAAILQPVTATAGSIGYPPPFAELE